MPPPCEVCGTPFPHTMRLFGANGAPDRTVCARCLADDFMPASWEEKRPYWTVDGRPVVEQDTHISRADEGAPTPRRREPAE